MSAPDDMGSPFRRAESLAETGGAEPAPPCSRPGGSRSVGCYQSVVLVMPEAGDDRDAPNLGCLVGVLQNVQSDADRGWKLLRIARDDSTGWPRLESLWRRPNDASLGYGETPVGSRDSVLSITATINQAKNATDMQIHRRAA